MFLKRFLIGALALAVPAAFGQAGNTVFGSGYAIPLPIPAAPGQILNLMVAGVGASLTGRVAAPSLPLPDKLANISVQLTQTAAPQSVAVPILAVRPVSTCAGGTAIGSAACGQYAVVSVQMPYELVPACPLCAAPFSNSAQLVVSENGTPGGVVTLNPVYDQIHVANSCDLDTAASLPCTPTPLVTHADGSLVTASNPAEVGEEVVIYALGLGSTNPPAPTGQDAPAPSPVPTTFAGVIYDYDVNAPPKKGIPAPYAACAIGTGCPEPPAFVGLTSGLVGLYQVNFVIPPSQGIFPCGAGVVSNLTLSLVGASSYDGAGICVI